MIRGLSVVMRRELKAIFSSFDALIALISSSVLISFLTFDVGDFFERNQASLAVSFYMLPFVYLVIAPVLSMKSWVLEFRSRSIELVLSSGLPLETFVLAKFLVSMLMIVGILVCTFPMWAIVNVLGSPDNGVIAMNYLVSCLIGGVYLAIGHMMSVLSRSLVVAFFLSMLGGFLLMMGGFSFVISILEALLPEHMVMAASDFSILSRVDHISKGVLAIDDLVYFVLVIIFCLKVSVILLERRAYL